MFNKQRFNNLLLEIGKNPEQLEAVNVHTNCVVLAGPGSGKTKTLTAAMARCLLEEVDEPRGIACITYNNECALELEQRLAALGIDPSERIFVGTVHSFALTQIILPYSKIALPEFQNGIRVGTTEELDRYVDEAYRNIGGVENVKAAWNIAKSKRITCIDRNQPEWRLENPRAAKLVEEYERLLRLNGLIDFDDMPLIAVRMLNQHAWIREAIAAKFPILFVDEYQDMGLALHKLVGSLCFETGIRLFAVGDPDQSIYAFSGANPALLEGLTQREGMKVIRLELNYRCGKSIVKVSDTALGENRAYRSPEGMDEGVVNFYHVDGNLTAQADGVIAQVIPRLIAEGIPLHEIAVLYRTVNEGNEIAKAAIRAGIPIVRADTNALVTRSSRLCRFIEACAKWQVEGWKEANPRFSTLVRQATSLVFGTHFTVEEQSQIAVDLMSVLGQQIDSSCSTNEWLRNLKAKLLILWQGRKRVIGEDWSQIDLMIAKTNPTGQTDLTLANFCGLQTNGGRLTLSTLHSAKGREFDGVVLFAMNKGVLPSDRDNRSAQQLKESRRLFYVGITRARKNLVISFQANESSPWVKEVYNKLKGKG